MASELTSLVESNTIRVLDLVILLNDEHGTVEASELRDVDDSGLAVSSKFCEANY